MDRLLRPKTLEIEATAPSAEKQFVHWRTTFENYLQESIAPVTPGTPGDDASIAAAAAATATNERKKLSALINTVSANIYELISDCATYSDAMTVLNAAFIRPTNIVYNRHQLITSKQEPGQTIDAYLQNLNRIAKSCNFDAVTAEQNKNQYIRDAFINGISSASIRQRLLENIGELSLQEACTQARALEQAQSQSAAYEQNNSSVAAIEEHSSANSSLAAAGRKPTPRKPPQTPTQKQSNLQPKKNSSCFWCGNAYHASMSDCPAKDDICNYCQKKGHWSRVCQSKAANTAIASMGISPNVEHNPYQNQHQQYHQQQQQQQQQQQHQQQQQQSYNPYLSGMDEQDLPGAE